MENREIRTERVLSVGSLTLVPVVERGCSGWQMGDFISFSGYKHPIAIVVISGGQKKAYRITGEEITIDELVKEFPSVKRDIEKL